MNEIVISLTLDHPNICRMHEVFESGGQGSGAVFLVMELCTGKELYDRLSELRRYSERDAVIVTGQMLDAIRYVHDHGICHRDLKLENWVYLNDDKDSPLKLIDFGFSKQFHPRVPMTAIQGTVYYVSAEVMKGSYNNLCDIWSLGMFLNF